MQILSGRENLVGISNTITGARCFVTCLRDFHQFQVQSYCPIEQYTEALGCTTDVHAADFGLPSTIKETATHSTSENSRTCEVNKIRT